MKTAKKFKAFTLIEMIIVMAILGILMSALMNFYRPVRQTFVDSTMIEDMRTTQNGILTYLTESVRYAENLTFYDQGAIVTVDPDTHKTVNVDSPAKAYEAFCKQNGIGLDASGDLDPDKAKSTKQRIRVIVINRGNGYTDTGTLVGARSAGFGGRIITNVIKTGDSDTPTAEQFTDAAGARTHAATGDSFMVLGGAYYGNSDFAIFIDKDKTWPGNAYGSTSEEAKDNLVRGGITFAVQTAMTDETGVVENGADYGSSTVEVTGGMVFLTTTQAANTMNSASPKYYVSGTDNDLSDPDKCKVSSNTTAGSMSPTGTGINKATDNTYIVVLEPYDNR